MKNWRRGVKLSLALSICTAAILVFSTFKPETLNLLRGFNLRYLALAVAMLAGAVVIEGYRISLIAISMGGQLTWLQGCSVFLGTTFASLSTPMGLGEIPALSWFYSHCGFNPGLAVAAAIVRNFTTKLAFLAGIIYLFGFCRQRIQFGPVTGDLFSLVALFFLLSLVLNASYVLLPGIFSRLFGLLPACLFQGRLGRWRQGLTHEAQEFDMGLRQLWSRHPLLLFPVGLLSLGYWGLYFGILPVLARGLNLYPNPAAIISRQFVLTLALPFIPIPGGSGAMELAMAGVYRGLIPRAFIGVLILSWRFFTYYLLLLLGAMTAIRRLWQD